MSDKVFLDTNILVYAHDTSDPIKYQTAAQLITNCWEDSNGVLSTQIIQELYVVLTQKVEKPLPPIATKRIIQTYFQWEVCQVSQKTILEAIDIQQRYQLSFWDALVVGAAIEINAQKIVTEDLNAGQEIEGILIENPFV